MAFNWPGIAAGLIGLVPAGAVLFGGFGRFDGHFRDNVVFLNLIGGLALGLVVALFLLLLGSFPYAFIAAFALLPAVLIGAVVNRRKWQGERHAVFNGGAQGAGLAATITLAIWRDRFELAAGPALEMLAGSVALALVLSAAGMLVGVAVLDRRPFRGIALAALALLPAGLLLYLLVVGGLWQALAILLPYAAAVHAHAEVKLLPRGVGEEGRKRDRREDRRRAREG